jgi:hypothetical protein
MIAAMMTLRSGAALCLALASIATGAAAQDIPLKQKFVAALQDAVRADDKTWLAGHMRYPMRYYGRRTILIPGKAWVARHYTSLVGAKLRHAVLAQDPADVFENWQGLMVGEGQYNVWIRNTGDGLNEHYEIVTINDVE